MKEPEKPAEVEAAEGEEGTEGAEGQQLQQRMEINQLLMEQKLIRKNLMIRRP